MKASYILFSVTAGVFVFCCVSVFFGPSGKNAYRELQVQKVNLVENIEKIEGISKSLKAEITALDYDDEIIKMYAHELGFVCEGERLIKLADYIEPGLSAFQRYQSGTPYHVEEPQTVPEWVSAFLGLLCVLFFLLFFYNFQKVGN
ncbi:MAG: septum formation initiator family protein [Spirochaetes bacterium]|uniref:Septum formation initiator family protein n=1 Tax=Candidatus Gallitreponema excrementavium TaxID=2840840 RepID=A0A9D9HP00_9SPIR|nr:septum formation initiator family protein [Candidatus Gallitreponema excrementavium]